MKDITRRLQALERALSAPPLARIWPSRESALAAGVVGGVVIIPPIVAGEWSGIAQEQQAALAEQIFVTTGDE